MNAILSIKPKYVEEILKGNKKYEFRKSIFKHKDQIEMIYIYSTSPEKKIVGTFIIKSIIEGHPKLLWERFQDESGISREDFFSYFADRKKGFAIEIGDLHVLEIPVDPKILIPDFVPPQSYCYLRGIRFNELNSNLFQKGETIDRKINSHN